TGCRNNRKSLAGEPGRGATNSCRCLNDATRRREAASAGRTTRWPRRPAPCARSAGRRSCPTRSVPSAASTRGGKFSQSRASSARAGGPGAMKSGVDARGGAFGPAVVVEGAVAAAREFGLASVLVGDKAAVEREIVRLKAQDLPVAVRHASQVV